MTTTDNPVARALVERILGEYREMPGLALTPEQARRLWGCDGLTCRAAIQLLVTRGALHWSRGGRLVSGADGNRDMGA